MHTSLCRHATGQPVEYAAQAARIGLAEIGFADHSPMLQDDFDDWRMRFSQLDEYVEMVRKAQREFPRMTIKLALEIDYLPGQEDWIRTLAARYPWDYLIGSVHYVTDTWVVDNPAQIHNWKGRDPDLVWVAYIARLGLAAASGLFDIIGHVDLPKKFGFYPHQQPETLFNSFLQKAREKGVVIELNTGGLRKDCREIYPSPALVQKMFQLGIPITFGSDAHAPAEVGMNFSEALALARQAGYTQSSTFTRRTRQLVSLV